MDASYAVTSWKSSSPESISPCATWSPALSGLPSTTVPWSLLTRATGILFAALNGSQNAHRYSAPYSSGISTIVTSATRGISPRENRLSSVPSDIPASMAILAFRCGVRQRVEFVGG